MRNKVLIVFLVAAVAVLGYIFFARNPNYIDQPRGGENIIAFGDSLTVGMGATFGNDYVSILSKRIGLPIINAGVSGDTTISASERIERDVLERDPKIVILELGGNDGLRRDNTAMVFERLQTMIRKIHSRGAAVLLLGIRPQLFSREYDRRFRKLARDEKVSFVPDLLGGILGRPEFMDDPIHPNNEGYAIIAEKIEPVLRKMLK